MSNSTSLNQLIVKYKFNKSIYENLIPEFNDGFTNYEIVDENIDSGIVTRSIYSDDLPTSINFTSQTSLVEVNYLNSSELTSAYNLFSGCSNLSYVNLSDSDFSKVDTIERMFNSCSNLINIDGLNELNMSNVGNMGGIFSDCSKITELNVKDWDVSKVTNFGAAFRRCKAITTIDLSNWDTSNAVLMSGMFTSCSKLTSIDISHFKTSKVTTVNQMFYDCGKLTSLNFFKYLNDNVDTLYLFGKCNSLNKVTMNDSDYKSANKVISALLSRTSADLGFLELLNIDDISQVAIESAQSKGWVILKDNIETNVINTIVGDQPCSFIMNGKSIKIICPVKR